MFTPVPALAHVDMDAFYASVEQRDFPELRGKPVVVGASDPTRRGVVSAASYEARRFGIHSAMPLRTAYRLCPQACFVGGRMDVYAAESKRIMAILRDYSPRVQPLSLDEAFVDLTGTELIFGPPVETLRQIKARVLRETGLVCSAGLAPVKFVAKIASDHDKPDGFTVVTAEGLLDFLHPLPVQRLWGVGPKTLAQLEAMGIATIGDLDRLGEAELERRFGRWGLRLARLARGVDPRAVEAEAPAEQSVGHEHTFDEDQDELRVLERTLLELSEKVARRLRRQGVAGRTLTLKLRTASFRTLTRSVTGSEYLDQGLLIFQAARRLMTDVDRRGEKVRLLGISLRKLLPRDAVPPSLFSAESPEREARLGQAMDALGERFGRDSVRRARLLGRSQP
ncbi:MAG: DNA polymerase IV [Candidatus Krumholzibacteriia bacterium]|nr:DNA polymerase IV [bacterium]MCB9513710.1 DNA polymerase IV [Candidatus Latescibacterota bacterium]MCB9515410.1 DNA polymerase IV [Candidatus Latescibacterota bacterium]